MNDDTRFPDSSETITVRPTFEIRGDEIQSDNGTLFLPSYNRIHKTFNIYREDNLDETVFYVPSGKIKNDVLTFEIDIDSNMLPNDVLNSVSFSTQFKAALRSIVDSHNPLEYTYLQVMLNDSGRMNFTQLALNNIKRLFLEELIEIAPQLTNFSYVVVPEL